MTTRCHLEEKRMTGNAKQVKDDISSITREMQMQMETEAYLMLAYESSFR